MRIRVPAANMRAGPQQLRFKFARSNNGIAYAAFGEEASPGVMKAGTIRNLCFDGQGGSCTTPVSLRASALYTKWFDYTLNSAKNYYVSFLHLCGPGGSAYGRTPDGVAFTGYDTSSGDELRYWYTSVANGLGHMASTWYNSLRDNGLAEARRGSEALIYGHYSRETGASITGGWTITNQIEGIEGIELAAPGTTSTGVNYKKWDYTLRFAYTFKVTIPEVQPCACVRRCAWYFWGRYCFCVPVALVCWGPKNIINEDDIIDLAKLSIGF